MMHMSVKALDFALQCFSCHLAYVSELVMFYDLLLLLLTAGICVLTSSRCAATSLILVGFP